jgi:hypothetical protein
MWCTVYLLPDLKLILSTFPHHRKFRGRNIIYNRATTYVYTALVGLKYSKLCTCHFYCTSTVGHKRQLYIQTVIIKILRTKYYLQPRYNLHTHHIGLVVCFNFLFHMYCNCNACQKYIYSEAVKSKDDFQNYLCHRVTHVCTGAVKAKKTFKTSFEKSRFLNKMKYCTTIQYSM